MGVLALGPISRGFSEWTLRFVGSVLSRAEMAARYLLMTQAHLMVGRCGFEIDRTLIAEALASGFVSNEAEVSVYETLRRLSALRALL